MKKENNQIKGFKTKVFVLILAAFIFGGAMFVTMYASGSEVIKNNEDMFMVSHTEYRYSEVGQIVVRLVDFSGGAIAVDNCTAKILYPDKTVFLGPALMNATNTITGDHYYEFTTPMGPEGVYEYQATCTFAAGSKIKSATNSFHLSSGFNSVLANLQEINASVTQFRTDVNNNFSTAYAMISGINTTGQISEMQVTLGQVNTTVNTINSNLNDFIVNTTVALAAIDVNTVAINNTVNTIYADLLSINSSMAVRFDAVDLAISDGFAAMAANFTDLHQYVSDVNASIIAAMQTANLNLTPVLDAIALVNSTLYNQISAVNLSIGSSIADFRQEVQANFSDVLAAIGGISIPDYSAILNQINTTTVDTYAYMTGTLATNINDILGALGVINATVNRIETTTNNINTTANQILQNQQDEVYISTYSG